MTDPLVEMHGITVDFPGVRAIDGVDLTLVEGEVHALMGENGAGKSTVIGALTGTYPLSAGAIRIGGESVSPSGVASARAAGIATVFQEAHLSPKLSVAENIMLGAEVRGRLGIDWKATRARAAEVLANLGLDDLDPRARLTSLSPAAKQLVAIARALVLEPRVLVLDEPTSSLDAAEVEQLFTVMRRLRDEGVAILFVSHFLDQVYEISDRLTVLRNGRFVAEHATAEIERSKLISEMIGKEAATLSAIEATARPDLSENDVVYAAEGIGRKGMLDAMDLEVRAGEVIGLAGLLGSGRTELARLIYGADRPDSGRVSIRGKKIDISRPAAALAHGIALSSENRRDEGIIRDLTVRENIILAVQAKRGWARPVPRREQDEIVRRYIDALGVRPPHPERPIKNLSGGNQQKVLLGRWLATHPDLLILDEPTRGIDVGAKAEIQEHVAKLADEGVSVIFISSELDEVVRLSDRIIVMKDHRKIAELDGGVGVSAESIVEAIAADHNEEEVSS